MLSRDSEDEMWSRLMFELLIWPQEVTLARWTQPSGPLCLWQCFYKQHYEWLFSSWRGISYLHSENKVMSKLQWFSHIFATKNVEAQSNVYERQTIFIKMFAVVIILETIETIDPAIAVPSNNLEEGRSMFVIDCLLYEHLHLLKDIIIWCTVYRDMLWG